MKAHKKAFPYAYPMKSPEAPAGVPWVSPMPTEDAGAFDAPAEPTEHEKTEGVGVQVTPEPTEQEPIPRESYQSGSSGDTEVDDNGDR
eukprot:8823525-Karenia_brevis.AAC.1